MKYIKIVLKYIVLLFFISVFLFILTRSIPVDPVKMLLQQYQLPETEQNVQALREQWGLNESYAVQYTRWMSAFLRGDWGVSLISKQDIRQEIFRGIPYSMTLGIGAILISSVLGFFLGYLASLKKGGFFDRLTAFLSILTQTVPLFMFCVVLIYYVGVKYKLARIFTGDVYVKMTLAILLTAFASVGSIARIMKKHFLKIQNQSYIKAEMARGFLLSEALLTAGVKPALIGLCSAIISKFAWVIGGSSVVEFIFSIHGVSFFLISGIMQRDYNIIQSYLFFIVIWMMVVHLVFEIFIKFLGERE